MREKGVWVISECECGDEECRICELRSYWRERKLQEPAFIASRGAPEVTGDCRSHD